MDAIHVDRAYWEWRARQYGELAAGYLDRTLYQYEEKLRWLAFVRAVSITPGMRLLDVGTGVGSWAMRLAKMGVKVVGVDLSSNMVSRARSRAKTEHISTSFLCCAAEALPFADDTFDAAVSVTVLQHITDDSRLANALMNIWRVVRPGGWVAAIESTPPTQPSKTVAYMRYRSAEGWRELFEDCGFILRREEGVRFIGPKLVKREWIKRPALAISLAVDRALQFVPGAVRWADLRIFILEPRKRR